MTTQDAYREWLASAPEDRAVLECLHVYHPAWDHVLLANWDRYIEVRHEDGVLVGYQPSRFQFAPAEVSDSTEQATSLTVSSLEGRIYDQLTGLSVDDRQHPILIALRLYFHDDLTTPLITPVPYWTLHAVECGREVLTGELRSTPLRIRRVGIYYTQTEFPALVYAT